MEMKETSGHHGNKFCFSVPVVPFLSLHHSFLPPFFPLLLGMVRLQVVMETRGIRRHSSSTHSSQQGVASRHLPHKQVSGPSSVAHSYLDFWITVLNRQDVKVKVMGWEYASDTSITFAFPFPSTATTVSLMLLSTSTSWFPAMARSTGFPPPSTAAPAPFRLVSPFLPLPLDRHGWIFFYIYLLTDLHQVIRTLPLKSNIAVEVPPPTGIVLPI